MLEYATRAPNAVLSYCCSSFYGIVAGQRLKFVQKRQRVICAIRGGWRDVCYVHQGVEVMLVTWLLSYGTYLGT